MMLTRAAVHLLPRCATSINIRAARGLQDYGRNYRFGALLSMSNDLPPIQYRAATNTPRQPEEPALRDASANEEKQGKKILLYELESKGSLRTASAISLMNALYFLGYVQIVDDMHAATGFDSEPWGMIGLLSSGVFVAAAWLFAKKLVHKAWYIPESHSLSFCTHYFSSKGREPRTIWVGSIQSAKRTDKSGYYPFKVQGERAFCLFDVRKGVFHNKELLCQLLDGTIDAKTARALSKGEHVSSSMPTEKEQRQQFYMKNTGQKKR